MSNFREFDRETGFLLLRFLCVSRLRPGYLGLQHRHERSGSLRNTGGTTRKIGTIDVRAGTWKTVGLQDLDVLREPRAPKSQICANR
jgi:hypothetical protein